MTERVCECEHKNIAINPSLTTSVMAITLNIFGFKCESCDKQWDIGNAVEAIQATERLTAKKARRFADLIDSEYGVGETVAQELYDYADILEKE